MKKTDLNDAFTIYSAVSHIRINRSHNKWNKKRKL